MKIILFLLWNIMFVGSVIALEKNEEVLFQAIENNDIEKVKQLIAGIDIYAPQDYKGEMLNAFQVAQKIGNKKIKTIFNRVAQENLIKAISYIDMVTIKKLVPQIFTSNQAFDVAIANNNVAAVVAILTTFNDVDVNRKDSDGNTPLMLAITAKNIDMVKALTLHGNLDLSLANKKGETATTLTQVIVDGNLKNQIMELFKPYQLFEAIKNNNLNDVKLLVENTPVIITQIFRGVPFLFLAVDRPSPEIVEFFLQNHADPEAKVTIDSEEKTALSFAKEKLAKARKLKLKESYGKIITLLEDAIAKIPPTKPLILIDEKPLLTLLQSLTQKLNALEQGILKK